MAIYKVHIKTVGDKTTYITNATILATITYYADLDKWEVTSSKESMMFDSIEDANKEAKQRITDLFSSLGIIPNFINE